MTIGSLNVYTSPYQVAAYRGLSLNSADAGVLVTVNVLATGVIALMLPLVAGRLSWRQLAIVGIALSIAGQLGSAIVAGVPSLILLRLLAGVGTGMVLGAVNALVAMRGDAEKAFGLVYGATSVMFMVILAAVPHLIDPAKATSLFGTLAAITAIAGSGVFMLPKSLVHAAAQAAARDKISLETIGLFVAVTLIMFMAGGTLAFSGLAAAKIGIATDHYAIMLASNAVAGTAGALFVGWAGARFGVGLPLLIGASLTGANLAALFLSDVSWIFAVGLCAYGFFYMLTMSYLLGLASAIDQTGKTAASIGGYCLLPFALGPAVFGWLISRLSWTVLGIVVMAGCSVAGILLLVVSRQRELVEQSLSRQGAKNKANML